MTFQDMNYWGIFKIILLVNWAIPILLIPFIFVFWLFKPDKITFSHDNTFELFGATITHGGEGFFASLAVLPIVIVTLIIGLVIQSAILLALAKHTPMGRIKIGGAPVALQDHQHQ